MKSKTRKVLLIVPSIVVAKGLESIFDNQGEFEVAGILPDLGRGSETRLRNVEALCRMTDVALFHDGINLRPIAFLLNRLDPLARTAYRLLFGLCRLLLLRLRAGLSLCPSGHPAYQIGCAETDAQRSQQSSQLIHREECG